MAGSDAASFDSVHLGAADPEPAARAYASLLGLEPVRLPSGAWRFQLDRGAVEIFGGAEGPRSLRFAVPAAAATTWARVEDFHGLRVETTPIVSLPRGAAATEGRRAEGARDTAPPADAVHAIDHVVVRSPNLERAAALWRDQLGVRLALDRAFPERGLRMLFFRSGGVTLEFVSAIAGGEAVGRDALDGIAYRVADLAACRARLVRAGFDVSPLRAGFKPGTAVATVRSGTAGVPTLLIQPARPAGER